MPPVTGYLGGEKRLAGSGQRETIKDQRPTAVVGRVIWGIPAIAF
jgi:hypothetical protein